MLLSRRHALVMLVSVVVSGCARVPPRATPPTPPPRPVVFTHWDTEARGILSDALEALQTFESFAAFRVSNAAASDRRAATDLAWDPPTTAAWDNAVHVARALHGRADQLLTSVSTAQIDRELWRDQRDIGNAAAGLVDLGVALRAYRDRLDRLKAVADASDTWDSLDDVWAHWQGSAGSWAISRSEAIGCTAA